MMKKRGVGCLWLFGLIAVLLLHTSVCQAYLVTATSTYAEVTDVASPMYNYLGQTWYRYEIALSWDASPESGQGLSHFDLVQAISCPTVLEDIGEYGESGDSQYFQFEPDDPLDIYAVGVSGYSTGEDYDEGNNTEYVPWYGHVELGDGAIPEVTGPIAKYQQPVPLAAGGFVSDEPGNSGTGTYWFYTVFAPDESQTSETVWESAVYFKAGNGGGITGVGNITGYMPYCIPEPTTIFLLGLGGLVLRKRK